MSTIDGGDFETITALLRIASEPVETLAEFGSKQLAESGAALAEAETLLRQQSQTLADCLGERLSAFDDVADRGALLDVRRRLHRGIEPWGPSVVDRLPLALDADLRAQVVEIAKRRADHGRRVAQFVVEFDDVVRADREALRAATRHPAFLAALTVDRVETGARWSRELARVPSKTARVLRLEHTVARYLFRAIGRPTPNGLWAGAAPVAHRSAGFVGSAGLVGSVDQVLIDADGDLVIAADETAIRLRVTPRLDLWAEVLSQSNRLRLDDPITRSGVALRAARPRFRDPVGWVYSVSDRRVSSSGTTGGDLACQPYDPLLARCLSPWTVGLRRTIVEGWDAVSTRFPELAREAFDAAIDHLVSIELLVPALALPDLIADPWEALVAIGDQGDAPPNWAETVCELRRLANELEPLLIGAVARGVIDERLGETLTATTAAVAGLRRSVGLIGDPGRVINVDLVGPWRASWGEVAQDRARRARQDLVDLHWAEGGFGERHRAKSAYHLAQATPSPLIEAAASWFDNERPSHGGDVRTRGEYLAATGISDTEAFLSDVLLHDDPTDDEVVLEVGLRAASKADLDGDEMARMPPSGSGTLLVGLGQRWSALWMRPQPDQASSRLRPWLDGTDNRQVSDESAVTERSQRTGEVQLWGADPRDRDPTIRPRRTQVVVVHAEPVHGGVDAYRIVQPAVTAPALLVAADNVALRPLYDAGAVIGTGEVVTHHLRTAAMSHGWELAGWGVPVLEGELTGEMAAPRLVSEHDTVLSPRRWVLGPETTAELRDLGEHLAFQQFQSWCRAAGVPAMVMVRTTARPDGLTVAFPTRSPLALRAILDQPHRLVSVLVLTEMPDPSSLPCDAEGRHHLAELAVSWNDTAPGTEYPAETRWEAVHVECDDWSRRVELVSSVLPDLLAGWPWYVVDVDGATVVEVAVLDPGLGGWSSRLAHEVSIERGLQIIEPMSDQQPPGSTHSSCVLDAATLGVAEIPSCYPALLALLTARAARLLAERATPGWPEVLGELNGCLEALVSDTEGTEILIEAAAWLRRRSGSREDERSGNADEQVVIPTSELGSPLVIEPWELSGWLGQPFTISVPDPGERIRLVARLLHTFITMLRPARGHDALEAEAQALDALALHRCS